MDIKTLISANPFEKTQEEKERILLPLIKNSLLNNFNNEFVSAYYKKIGFDLRKINFLEDIPFIHASCFKNFDLATVEKDKIIRVLTSSSTTGQSPSRVPLDKETALRQTIALKSVLSNYLGKKRIPMLVFDFEKSNAESESLTARGAGIRGFANFASETYYLIDEKEGSFILNKPLLLRANKEYADKEIFLFGFTYLLWEVLTKENGPGELSFKKMKIFHGGGWKKLESKKVSKAIFNEKISGYFGCPSSQIYDFYGMVEQSGLVFIDCEQGFKHVPLFADLITRDFYTLQSITKREGLVNIINLIPSSYPGQSIITDDKAIIFGVDDCKCGRKGKYFEFTSRVINQEVRGCGDTMHNIK